MSTNKRSLCLILVITWITLIIGAFPLQAEDKKITVPLSAVKDRYFSELNSDQLTKQEVTVPSEWVTQEYLTGEDNQEGNKLNTHSSKMGAGADPEVVTLGPKEPVYHPEWKPYRGRHAIAFNLPRKKPVLAPVDMKLVGFHNRNAEYRIRADDSKDSPYDDLQVWFRSQDPKYPHMVVTCYHLIASPLLKGQGINKGCKRHESWAEDRPFPRQGHVFYTYKDYDTGPEGNASSCKALLGRSVEKGDVIGYVGEASNPHVSFGFKIYDEKVNPKVTRGNKHLHWVQPGAYFDWKCYNPEAKFEENVLAYPFECGGYKVSEEKQDPYFKYDS